MQASWWSLKKQFKGVFHNVSRVIDCVSCQKCRLHAKVRTPPPPVIAC